MGCFFLYLCFYRQVGSGNERGNSVGMTFKCSSDFLEVPTGEKRAELSGMDWLPYNESSH